MQKNTLPEEQGEKNKKVTDFCFWLIWY